MKIYAIRDRLIDYFMAPFAGPDTHTDVLAAVATQVNSGSTDAIAEAPHHFEIWTLGEVLEDGQLIAKKEFLADCSSLIRTGIRRGTSTAGGNPGTEPPDFQRTRPGGRDRGHPATNPAPLAHAAQEPPPAVTEASQGP